jgi:flavin-dependent dehydrogenase
VVGGSFAGLVVARVAASRGLRVLVVDRRSRAGARVHTTGILVKEAAEALDVPVALTRKVSAVRLYTPAMRIVDLRAPGYYFLATDTPALLDWLAAGACEAGAELRYGVRFDGAVRDGDRLRFADVRARYLVGADGARSRVARCFGLGRSRRFLVGIEAEFARGDRLDPGYLHCFIDRAIAPGYIGWAVPGLGITQVGLACDHPARPDLQALLAKIAPLADLRRERPIDWRAGTIPVGGPVRPFAAPGVLLVGDAAGWVSPVTGGGIANALHLGRRAALAICDHLLDSGPEPSAVLASVLPRYRIKGLARRALSAWAPDRLVEGALDTSLAAHVARRVFFHARAGARRAPRGDFRADGAMAVPVRRVPG